MQYKLPIASSDTLGGVRIGDTLKINSDGVIEVKGLNEIKTSYEEAIANVYAGKTLIADAITGKGVPTESDASFQKMAENIGKISSGGGLGAGRLVLLHMNYVGDGCVIAGTYKEVDTE